MVIEAHLSQVEVQQRSASTDAIREATELLYQLCTN